MPSAKNVILVAEDDENLRDLYTLALENKGYKVMAAKNGKEALEMLEKNYENIKLMFLDIIMPKMDGFDVLKEIRSSNNFSKLPVIVNTNLEHGNDRAEAMKLGATDYFVKCDTTPMQLVEIAKKYVS